MKWLFTGFDSAAASIKEGFGFNYCRAENMETRSRNWEVARLLYCGALITRHADRDEPPLYLVVSISHLTVNSAVKQLSALYCLQAHLTIKLPLIFSKASEVFRRPRGCKLLPLELWSHPPAFKAAMKNIFFSPVGVNENILIL